MALSVNPTHYGIPERVVTARPIIAAPSRMVVASGLAALFVYSMASALFVPTGGLDLTLIKFIQGIELGPFEAVVHGVNDLTASTGAIATWALLLVGFSVMRWYLPALALSSLPVAGAINETIGTFLVPRTRPHLVELERNSLNFEERSFPSGHVVGAVMLYGLVFVLAGQIPHRGLRLAIRTGSVAILTIVGFGRVWTGAHWPTDVTGAYALGGLLLLALASVHERLRVATDGLPFIRAGNIAHSETIEHRHALTSVVIFDDETVTKVYNPGFVPSAIYWLAYQSPFAYARNRDALQAAMHRRNLAGRLTEYWYGANLVARAERIVSVGDRLGLVSERLHGGTPRDRARAKVFLHGLRVRFEAAGLPTWQIDPRQPRAIDNVLETEDGAYKIVDLESGLVSPIASLRTWGRALRRGAAPFYDEVFFDVTRAYLAREEVAMRATLGDAGYTELIAELDALEVATTRWHASEPRLINKVMRGLATGFGVRTWPARTKALLVSSQDKGQLWMDGAVQIWVDEGRIDEAEAAMLREQIAAPTFQAMLPYLSAHIAVSIPLRFPFGSIARTAMVLGALGVATTRLLMRKIDRKQWQLAWSIHSPLVALVAAIPGFGTFAYLFAKPVRANRLLLRNLMDVAARKTPKLLYQRSGMQRFIARPQTLADTAAHDAAVQAPAQALPVVTAVITHPAPSRRSARKSRVAVAERESTNLDWAPDPTTCAA